jgi:type I restriction enzyme M protein
VANPPFSANWSASPLFMNDDRFSAYGKLAPSSKADFAFVQHMVHQLDDNGTMALFCSTGFVSWRCRRSHTPVFNKREELPRCRDWYACQYFLRNEYPDLYFGLEEKSTDAKHILFMTPANISKR